MELEELLSKLDLIEEQARLTHDEYPKHLTKERQRMIIALVKHIRWEVLDSGQPVDEDATVALPGVQLQN